MNKLRIYILMLPRNRLLRMNVHPYAGRQILCLSKAGKLHYDTIGGGNFPDL